MTIPLPALKPDGEGRYTFCPVCAGYWLALAGGLLVLWLLWRRRQGG